MILTKEKIKNEIEANNILINPYDPHSLGSASYDLSIGSTFRIFENNIKGFDITENSNYKDITRPVEVKEYYLLQPNELVLGVTREEIQLPGNIAGILTGRSRFARVGLEVHITASLVQPGVKNRQVMEIKNAGTIPLKIHIGTRLMQIIFVRCEGSSVYKGIYRNQKKV